MRDTVIVRLLIAAIVIIVANVVSLIINDRPLMVVTNVVLSFLTILNIRAKV